MPRRPRTRSTAPQRPRPARAPVATPEVLQAPAAELPRAPGARQRPQPVASQPRYHAQLTDFTYVAKDILRITIISLFILGAMLGVSRVIG